MSFFHGLGSNTNQDARPPRMTWLLLVINLTAVTPKATAVLIVWTEATLWLICYPWSRTSSF